MRRHLAAGAVLGMVLGAAVATGAQADPVRGEDGYAPGPISWGTCDNPALNSRGAQCGLLTVPLDYDDPSGPTIKLAVSRIQHKVPAAQYQGVMLVNPGGPGGSGLVLSVLGEFVPGHAGDAYDWIGFDPRGVGSSRPALSCDGNYFSYDRPDYVPTSRKLEKFWLAKAAKYARDCAAAGGPLLQHLRTTDTVQDMDSLRKALGADKINFYGFSYGTYLGQVYSTLYPSRVRRMVLDGNVDPRRVWYAANLDQDIAFDRNMGIYFTWVAKYDDIYHLGKTARAVQKLFYAERAKLLRNPAGGIIGGDELTDVFLSAGYYVFGWEAVAQAFSAWVNDHDFSGLKTLYDQGQPQGPGADNGYAIYLAVQCTDVQWPKKFSTWRKDNDRVYKRAPFETWANAWFNAPCLTWPAPAGTPVHVNGTKVPPILLISETNDAATPYPGSLEVRRRYPRAVLVEGVGGTTHAGSLSGIACVDDTVAAYLATGALPARVAGNRSDRQCPPLPQPTPSARAGKSPGAAGVLRADLQRFVLAS
ncbi:alpha/beta hydrolase [Krasilnikovia sp. MM14-A1259]|uniref:alpha/beta hydrolase n=1 Tax=Krasilnikovia sp. MM14-A1259 TaxID=3373539 RepID=UPI00380D5BB4